MKKIFLSVLLCLSTVAVFAQTTSVDRITKIGFIYYKDGQVQNAQKVVNFILEKKPDYPDAFVLQRILQKKGISDFQPTSTTIKFYFIETLSKVSADTSKLKMNGFNELGTMLQKWQTLDSADPEIKNALTTVKSFKNIATNLEMVKNHPREYVFGATEKAEIIKDVQELKDFWKPEANSETIATNNLLVLGQDLHAEGKCRNSLQVFDLVLSIDPQNVSALTKKALIMSDWKLVKTDLLLLCDAFQKADSKTKILIFGNLLYGYPLSFDRDILKYKDIETIKKILGFWVDHEYTNGFNSAELQNANEYVRNIAEFEALFKVGRITKTATDVVVEKDNVITQYSFDFIEASASKAVEMFSKHTPVCSEAQAELEQKEKSITWSQVNQKLNKILK